MRNRTAQLVLVCAAAVAAAWTVSNVRAALQPLSSRGIGAVSSDFGAGVLFLVSLVIVNWLVRGIAFRRGPLALRFRKAHLWFTLGYLALAGLAEVWLWRANAAGAEPLSQAITVLGVIGAPFLPVQGFFLVSALAFAIGNPTPRRSESTGGPD
jgi:hypothetical protein